MKQIDTKSFGDIILEKEGEGLDKYEVDIEWQDLVTNPHCVDWMLITLDDDEKVLTVEKPYKDYPFGVKIGFESCYEGKGNLTIKLQNINFPTQSEKEMR